MAMKNTSLNYSYYYWKGSNILYICFKVFGAQEEYKKGWNFQKWNWIVFCIPKFKWVTLNASASCSRARSWRNQEALPLSPTSLLKSKSSNIKLSSLEGSTNTSCQTKYLRLEILSIQIFITTLCLVEEECNNLMIWNLSDITRILKKSWNHCW